MSEFAPTTTMETPIPQERPELHLVEELPTTPDEAGRYDVDFAHDAAKIENVQRDMINEARANVELALAQKSPLAEKYQGKLANAEMSLKVNTKETEKLYDRLHGPDAQSKAKNPDELRLAA